MENKTELAYFLFTMKKSLPFDDEKDFLNKIKENKEFRIKIQKLVYISKFFGWENSYIFTLNSNGPYSVNLADSYYNMDFKKSSKIEKFDQKNFLHFVCKKSIEFLETVSTLLYLFKDKSSSFNAEECLNSLNEIKPHISKDCIQSAYSHIKKFDLIKEHTANISHEQLSDYELTINNEITKITEYVDLLKICRNHTLILGSLEYIRITLQKQNLSLSEKKDLLDLVNMYIQTIFEFLEKFEKSSVNFEDMNLELVEKIFNQIQNYVSNEKNVILRSDDENFDFNNYY